MAVLVALATAPVAAAYVGPAPQTLSGNYSALQAMIDGTGAPSGGLPALVRAGQVAGRLPTAGRWLSASAVVRSREPAP
jgi:hypothetical protein